MYRLSTVESSETLLAVEREVRRVKRDGREKALFYSEEGRARAAYL